MTPRHCGTCGARLTPEALAAPVVGMVAVVVAEDDVDGIVPILPPVGAHVQEVQEPGPSSVTHERARESTGEHEVRSTPARQLPAEHRRARPEPLPARQRV